MVFKFAKATTVARVLEVQPNNFERLVMPLHPNLREESMHSRMLGRG